MKQERKRYLQNLHLLRQSRQCSLTSRLRLSGLLPPAHLLALGAPRSLEGARQHDHTLVELLRQPDGLEGLWGRWLGEVGEFSFGHFVLLFFCFLDEVSR